MSEKIFKGHDNTIELELREDNAAANLEAITRIVVKLDDGTVIDSAVAGSGAGGVVDWSEGAGKLILRLGGQNIDPGRYTATVVIYDSGNYDDGLVWASFNLEVKAQVVT